MNPSMLAAERRRVPARRGGMTVLGKVAVPKPLNLPSQRLENHGLDPNFEIVPKGTLSWGGRAASSGSNAWLSSAPNADGGNTAHSHGSGRPSSGGSGTRPSTSDSDRTNLPVSNVWCSNSRPSTASGSLTSNQTSLRPRSAETRPNSSQVSRFSEPVCESSTAWGASGVGERLGVKSFKEDGFSLSSRDFPTLGSEKENSVMNTKAQDNCRPSSASDRTARAKEEEAKFHTDTQRGIMNTLRTDGPHTTEDAIFPRMENWQGEPQQYFNTNIPSQHFDAWHSPPFNAPAGPWYRGRTPGPPFGGHVAPGGFPMEPFPYYPPQISHPSVGGAQSVPPAGSGPRGTHPRNGDLYRPPMPDAYARPGIQFRPGFYRGPPVPPGQMSFEGYYGPPRAYCSNEREIPFMTGRPPPSYNGFQAMGAHDPTNFPVGTIGHGPSGKTLPVQMESDHQSQQRVPSKNHNEWYRKDEENWGRDIHPNALHSGKGSLPAMASQNNEWGADEDVENDRYAKRTVPSDYARNFEHQGHSSDSVRVRSIESMGSSEFVNDNLTNESPNVASFPTEGCQIPLANERNPSLQGETKDSVLMQKFEVPNAKFCVSSDGQCDAPIAFNREESRIRFPVEKKLNNSSVEAISAAGSFERVPASVDFSSAPHQATVPKQSTSGVSRSSYHVGHGRDNRVRDPNDAGKTTEGSMIDSVRKIEGEPVEETSDPSDIQEQRARRRELAKQRVLQLHKEEEERTREQKAKAFAKLEELNRRTQVGENANKKVETTESFGDIYGEQEKLCTHGGTVLADPKFQAPGQNLVFNSNVTDRESSISQSAESVEETKNLPVEPPRQLEPNLSHGQSSRMKDPRDARKVGMQLNDGGISKHNRTGYKQKQNKSSVKSSQEKSVANIACEAPEDLVSVPTNFTSSEAASSEIQLGDESNVLNTSNIVPEPSIQQRRKSNSSKNKHKLDEAPIFPVSSVLSDGNSVKPSEDVESKASWSNLDNSAVTVADLDVEPKAAKAFSSLPNEEVHRRVANQLKRQPFRRPLRSQQPNKFMDVNHGSDTVIWAPVRTQNKPESVIEVDKKSTLEMDNATNSDNMAQSISRGKRAEMERYVPKPVALELALQGSTPHIPYSSNMLKSDEVPGVLQFGSFGSVSPQPVSSVTVFVAPKVETKEGEDKHKIHKKEHGTQRQRGSTDSSHVKGVNLGPALISEPSKDFPKSTEQHQFVNSVTNSANADTSDIHSIADNTTAAEMSKIPAVKDHEPAVRGRRHPPWVPRVPRSTGNNPDNGGILCNETDGSGTLGAADVDHPDRGIVSKGSRSRGDQPLSHWKPKFNSKAASNLHDNKNTGFETVAMEITGASKKDHPSQQTVQVLPQNDKRSRSSYRPVPGQDVPESIVAEESGNQQEFDREKKPSSAKEPPFSLNKDSISTESAPSANTDVKHEHDISTGSRRSGKQNSRTMRGHESCGDWATGPENRPTLTHRFRERQRWNGHYEYQPVGPPKSSGPEKLDGPAVEASNVRLINQERGQNHPKH